jgi:hypothetical protein
VSLSPSDGVRAVPPRRASSPLPEVRLTVLLVQRGAHSRALRRTNRWRLRSEIPSGRIVGVGNLTPTASDGRSSSIRPGKLDQAEGPRGAMQTFGRPTNLAFDRDLRTAN